MKKFFSVLLVVICIVAVCIACLWFFSKHGDDGIGGETLTSEDIQPRSTEKIENKPLGSPYKTYYNELSTVEKRAYDKILSEIYSMPEEILIPRLDDEKLDVVFAALLRDNPDIFFVGRRISRRSLGLGLLCSIEYIFPKEEYEMRKAELDEACNEIIASLSDPADEWQTELEIHDYIINNCSYKLVEDDHVYSSAYGVLVNGEAACEGYSKAAKLLFDRVGIESAVVCGNSESPDGSRGAHMWNAVKIDGEYYYLDCTWDDPVSQNKGGSECHSYFNVSEEILSATHSDFSYDFDCKSTDANYHVKRGLYFEEYSRDYEDEIAASVANELEAGNDKIELRFGSEKAYKKAADDLLGNERIFSVLSKARSQTDISFSVEEITHGEKPELNILIVIPKR